MGKFSDESLRAALEGRKVLRKCEFPGMRGTYLGVRVLTDGELDKARLAAAEVVKNKHASMLIDPDFLDRVVQREIVSRAFFDIDKPDEYFFSKQEDVAELDTLTVRSLYELYVMHQQELDPLAYCTDEQAEEIVEALGKSNAEREALTLYDARTLRSFVISLASKLRETRPPPK